MAEFFGVDDLRRGRSLPWTAATIVFGDLFCDATRQCDITLADHIVM